MHSPFNAVLLPGVVLPAEPAYGALVAALGAASDARAKDLELYRQASPPEDYSLDIEVDGLLRAADDWGFGRFHLVGYSAGGSVALATVAVRPDRVASVALLEPAWAGSQGIDAAEQAAWDAVAEAADLPPDEVFDRFVRAQLRPGVEPPPPPEGPPPPWMASRPAGIRTVTDAFRAWELDRAALAAFERPVLYVFGGRSNPDLYETRMHRLAGVFRDFTSEVFAERHHFDPPHRGEPERLAELLLAFWGRAEGR